MSSSCLYDGKEETKQQRFDKSLSFSNSFEIFFSFYVSELFSSVEIIRFLISYHDGLLQLMKVFSQCGRQRSKFAVERTCLLMHSAI